MNREYYLNRYKDSKVILFGPAEKLNPIRGFNYSSAQLKAIRIKNGEIDGYYLGSEPNVKAWYRSKKEWADWPQVDLSDIEQVEEYI